MSDLSRIISELHELDAQYSNLLFDEDSISQIGEPADDKNIEMLERRYSVSLPAGYTEFLRLHDGWKDLSGCGTMLASTEHDAPWVVAELDVRRTQFSEYGKVFPLDAGGVPIVLGQGHHNMLVCNPSRLDSGKVFIEYDWLSDLVRTYDNFMEYLIKVRDELSYLVKVEAEGN